MMLGGYTSNFSVGIQCELNYYCMSILAILQIFQRSHNKVVSPSTNIIYRKAVDLKILIIYLIPQPHSSYSVLMDTPHDEYYSYQFKLTRTGESHGQAFLRLEIN